MGGMYGAQQPIDEDAEMCAICEAHYVQGHLEKDMDWIGCEYEGC